MSGSWAGRDEGERHQERGMEAASVLFCEPVTEQGGAILFIPPVPMNAETDEHFTISSSKENQRLKSFLRERERE